MAKHQYTPAWAAKVTGLPAATITAMAEEYATAKPAAIFCNAGISHQLGAFDTYRVAAFLAAVTGNIGRPGRRLQLHAQHLARRPSSAPARGGGTRAT